MALSRYLRSQMPMVDTGQSTCWALSQAVLRVYLRSFSHCMGPVDPDIFYSFLLFYF